MKTELATTAIKVANSIEAHLTGAVATISQRNQGNSLDVGQAVFAGGAGIFVFHVFDFLSFKAKAFRFCLFCCPVAKRIFN